MSKEFKEIAKKIIFNLARQRGFDPDKIYEEEKCLRWSIEQALHEAERRGFDKALDLAAEIANSRISLPSTGNDWRLGNNTASAVIRDEILKLKPPRPLEEKK